MSITGLRRIRRKIGARRRRWQHPVLSRTLENLCDDAIDRALRYAGLSRAQLFTSKNAIARHRVRMAYMLAALDVDVDDAVQGNWEAFKEADRNCSLCRQPGRCRRWLDWGQINDAPRMFCPNADLFLKIRADQENSRCTDLD
jgi:hypothetical protein